VRITRPRMAPRATRNADLPRSARDGIGEQPEEANRGEQRVDRVEEPGQSRQQPFRDDGGAASRTS
jgi:hypothetical protein